jgi:YD repeat-containing protein
LATSNTNQYVTHAADSVMHNCGNYWGYSCPSGVPQWAPGSTTTYQYSGLDLLTRVTDQLNNVTTISYDSLGRKTALVDRDMGSWSYAYNNDGTLKRQTDTTNKTICLFYDSIDRMTGKDSRSDTNCPATIPSTADVWYVYDATTGGNRGMGRRTSIIAGGNRTYWQYDNRGRVTKATHWVDGVNNASVFDYTYDRADRLTSITYLTINGSTELVKYTYDQAWRQTSVCGTVCYASQATYTALDQPDTLLFSSGFLQDWSYNTRGFVQMTAVGSQFYRGYTYDGVGNVTRIDNAASASQPQYFHYDERDRLVSAGAFSGSAEVNEVVKVRAKGENVDGWPTMQLLINGSVKATWTVNSTNWADYSYTLTQPITPDDTVDITYTNNYSNATDDRDLYVQSVHIGAEGTSASSRAVSIDKGPLDGREVYASDGNMFWNGALRLTQQYRYNAIGNLTHKEGATFSYGTQASTCAGGALNKPPALVSALGTSYCYDAAVGWFISADTIVPGSGALTVWQSDSAALSAWQGAAGGGLANPQDLNRYSYVNNNPVTNVDPTGHWLESAIDIGFIAYDLYDIQQNRLNWTNGLALTADIVSLAVPVVAGGGMAVRAAAHVDDVAAAVTTANKADTAVDATAAAITKADEVGAFCSFAADTPVQTRRRETARHETRDARHETNRISASSASSAVKSAAFAPLRLCGSNKHPIFVVGQDWTAVGDLRVGDAVQQRDSTPDRLHA